MGCCFSNDDKDDFQDPDLNESTSLLRNPANPDGPSSRQIQSYNTQASAPASQKTGDEQSALNRILHQTANNVIDVSAIDSQTMEQHEYMDRARQYSTRLALACSSTQRMRSTPALPAGVAAPQVILASQPPSLADTQMITSAAETIHKTVTDIKIQPVQKSATMVRSSLRMNVSVKNQEKKTC